MRLPILISLALSLLLLVAPSAEGKDLTLEEIKERYVGKEVILAGHVDTAGDKLIDWYYAEGSENSGFRASRAIAPAALRGTRATVISVQMNKGFAADQGIGRADAFGKIIAADGIRNPYIEVFVKTVGEEAFFVATNHFINLTRGKVLQLASDSDKLQIAVELELRALLGKTLYNVGYSWLNPENSTPDQLRNILTRQANADRATPNFTALRVIETKYIAADSAALIKVELPDGSKRVAYGDASAYLASHARGTTSLERLGVNLLSSIPKTLSKDEISAIRKSEIFRGMSTIAVYYSWGYAEKTNDWGKNGTQMVFSRGQNVYIEMKKVRDWQSIR